MSAVGSFNTQDVHGLNNPHAQTSKTVYFPKACVAPPRLPLGLTSVHMRPGSNIRIRAYADNVDTQKFTAHVDTWADTTLYSAEFNYLIEKPANLDFQSGEFDTHQDHTCARPQRATLCRVNFARPFITPPKLAVFLKAWDIRGGTYARLKTYASNIDAKGFTIHIDTWDDTILFWAVAGWIAYPEDKDYIYSGIANTGEVHPSHSSHVHTRSDITFRGTEFLKRPSVFFALNQFDMATDANLRIRAYVDNVSTEGMTWHIDSCAGTKHWSAGISYIAFN